MKSITIAEFIKELKKVKYLVLVLFIIPIVAGMYLFSITPKAYESTVKILPVGNAEDRNQSRIGSLASLAGLNMNTLSTGLPPSAYEFVLESPTFLLSVLYEKISVDGKEMTVFEYMHSQEELDIFQKEKNVNLDSSEFRRKDDLPSLSILSTSEMPVLSIKGYESRAVSRLKGGIGFNYESPKPIEIILSTQNPEASANILKIILIKLEVFVKQFSKDNASESLDFLRGEVDKAKQEMYRLQSALANAKDQSINANKAIVRLPSERLEMDYMEARRKYVELNNQLEVTRIQTDKENPVFIILNPPSVSTVKAYVAPRFPIYLILSIIVGAFLSMFVVFFIGFVKRNF